MKEIDKYMTVAEAADRWGIPIETLKNKLKPSLSSSWAQTEKMIEEGLLKYYQKDDDGNRKWIISEAAMKLWFGDKRKKLKIT